jgi:hypothetical protein
MDGYQKMCDTNKNVTKMGVIIKGVYCSCQLMLKLCQTWMISKNSVGCHNSLGLVIVPTFILLNLHIFLRIIIILIGGYSIIYHLLIEKYKSLLMCILDC